MRLRRSYDNVAGGEFGVSYKIVTTVIVNLFGNGPFSGPLYKAQSGHVEWVDHNDNRQQQDEGRQKNQQGIYEFFHGVKIENR